MIILIYYYLSTAISCNWMNCEVREFCQFMDYAEERIIPQFFRCANHIYQEVRKGAEVEPFECGIDNLENWQKVVLHFIVKVHAEVLKCRKPISHVGFTEFPPCFLLLTVSNYFLERKNQLLKENPESYLSGANSWLLTDLFYYWNQFIEYITTPTEDDYELKAKNYYKNQAFGLLLARYFIFCLYNFAEASSTKKKTNVTKKLFTLLGKLFHLSINFAKCILDMMENDLAQIKNTKDDSTIISENLFPRIRNNYGKTVWVIKHKILRMISNILNYDCKQDPSAFKNKSYVAALFKDFIFDTLQQQSELESGDLLAKRSIITALDSISLIDLSSIETQNVKNQVSAIIQICKKLLSSENRDIRLVTKKALGLFFSKTNYYSDDLLDCIIKSHELSSNDITDYCALLKGITNSLNISKSEISESILEGLKFKINNLFETVCVNETMEYLTVENEEEKTNLHKKNINQCLLLIGNAFQLINDNVLCEKLLSYIKEKTEEMSSYSIQELFNSMIVPLTVVLIEICRWIERKALLEAFNKHSYSFLANLIRILIKIGDPFAYTQYHSLFTLLGTLSEIGILHTHLSMDMLTNNSINEGGKKDFIYDYILPIIIKEIADMEDFEDDMLWIPNIIVDKMSQAFWACNRIIRNDVALNGGERSLVILNESINAMFETIECFTNFKQGSTHIDKLDELYVNAFSTCLIDRRNMAELAPKLVQHLQILYRVSINQKLEMEILEIVEYLIDNQIISPWVNEILWVEELYVNGTSSIEEALLNRVKRKIGIFAEDHQQTF
ncbi:predicted protein [Naegleria gruberi]|uniref:Predicted protein n=1 Tax=Naegleria gruberi TaxID=5762 RepID=D2V2Q9_NAEGR|nr:uncharacterized protein NAEGRDRAFT_63085 [Naegleria gruberi]EFC49103.1 predicted protein [Naegleria gruberi]|eukprot:XP_002681847.1 predicted protein [Naegleria gruberi strain NEG-M]